MKWNKLKRKEEIILNQMQQTQRYTQTQQEENTTGTKSNEKNQSKQAKSLRRLADLAYSRANVGRYPICATGHFTGPLVQNQCNSYCCGPL